MGIKQRNVVEVIVLSIVTCGIYTLFWMYVTRDEFKRVSGDTGMSAGMELLLCILCFPFIYYWYYKFAKDIDEYQRRRGNFASDDSIILVVLLFLGLGIVSQAIIQDRLNKLA